MKSAAEIRNPNVINISNVCNQNCIFCSGYPRKKIEPAEVYEKIDSAEKEIYLQGGEPTLEPNLFDYITYAKGRGKYVTLVTNGLRLSYLPYAKKLLSTGLDQIFFALHAPDPQLNDLLSRRKGSFVKKEQALRNLSSLVSRRIVRLVYVVNKHNHERLIELIMLARKFRCVGAVEFKLIQALGNPEENLKHFVKIDDFSKMLNDSIRLSKSYPFAVYTNGIPLCYLGENKQCSIESWQMRSGKGILSGRTYIKKCESCKDRKFCMGFRKDYLNFLEKESHSPTNKIPRMRKFASLIYPRVIEDFAGLCGSGDFSCSLKYEDGNIHSNRFEVCLSQNIQTSLNSFFSFAASLEKRFRTHLDKDRFREILGFADESKIDFVAAGIDLREQIGESRFKMWVSVRSDTSFFAWVKDRLISEDLSRYLIGEDLLVGVDMYLSGKSLVKVYLPYSIRGIKEGFARGIFPEDIQGLLRYAKEMEIVKSAGGTTVFHVYPDDFREFIRKLDNPSVDRIVHRLNRAGLEPNRLSLTESFVKGKDDCFNIYC